MSIKYAFPLKIPDNSPDNFIMFSHAAEVYILIVNTQRFLYAYLLSALPCAGACGPCRPCVPPSGGRFIPLRRARARLRLHKRLRRILPSSKLLQISPASSCFC